MDNKQIKTIMDNYIQDGSKTVLECFQTICTNIGLTKEFNVLVYLEKIMKNNTAIAEFNAQHQYEKSSQLCAQNASLYTRIQQELTNEQQNAAETADNTVQ